MKTNNKEEVPMENLLQQLIKAVSETALKVDMLNKQMAHIGHLSKKVDEIHRLHFPKDELERNNNLREKFLAEIILGIPRKRKK